MSKSKKRRVLWADHVLRGQKRRTTARPMYAKAAQSRTASKAQWRRGNQLKKEKSK